MPEEKEEMPDIYSDLFNIHENPLGITFVLHRSGIPQGSSVSSNQAKGTKTVAILRFSPENWKVILMTGRKQLKNREQANGVPYKVAGELLQSLGLTEADW